MTCAKSGFVLPFGRVFLICVCIKNVQNKQFITLQYKNNLHSAYKCNISLTTCKCELASQIILTFIAPFPRYASDMIMNPILLYLR